jgi:hypothetical protein
MGTRTPRLDDLFGLLLAALLAVPAIADEWDAATASDGSSTTTNVLLHGSTQPHDLGAGPLPQSLPDEDWYRVAVHPYSSYQFVVDGQTGMVDLGAAQVQRVLADGSSTAQDALDLGTAVTLDWVRGESTPVTNFVRVRGAACGSTCRGTDRYTARFYDTTYTVPRFNNSGTQATALTVQNATGRTCDVSFFYLDGDGTLIVGTPGTALGPRRLLVVATASVVPNRSGSVRIAHTCGFGGLSGKAVSVEPATGLTFDTPMLHRPH